MRNITTSYQYDFANIGADIYFRTTVTDPKGHRVQTLSGTNGQQIKTITPMNTVTTFDYSPLAQLLRSTDPDGLATYYQYDMLGRLMTRTHPDAGIDRYEYDPAGNMVKHINGNGQTIEYRYDYNRLTDIEYPDYPANNVHYTYGGTGAVDNRAGRIAFQEDASGWQIFSYGKLGEVTENIRTFALPNESKPYTFIMAYNYDSFNRMQQMTYPDGEVVGYFYNSGGMLDSIGGTKMGQAYPYVNHIAYDKFELKDSVLYGNGTLTTYEYDTLQRLVHLTSQTGTATAEPMQILDYDFDDVGNIGKIINSAGILANGMGGTYNSDYTYDSLYRLKTSAGNWNGNPNTNFHLSMKYTSNGRICLKSLNNVRTVKNNSYDNLLDYKRTYSYYSGSNKLENITDGNAPTQDFRWDGNGNLVSHSNISKNCFRQYCWDEDNRMLGAADCEYASFYQYDANGERTYKLTGVNVQQGINEDIQNYSFFDQPTLYASPYVVCTPKGYTKHYYAESERVASKIGNGCLSDICSSINPIGSFDEHDDQTTNPYLLDCKSSNDYFAEKQQLNMDHLDKVLECLHSKAEVKQDILNPLYNLKNCALGREKECYWYHPDHLGSSSWITFSDGEAVQHLHYLPWGEDFVDQRTTNWAARYAFSAKERDAETGLSYFGSRYYSSDLSIWLSVDPMSDKYPSFSPYTYCANNPVKLVDPNGEDYETIIDKENKTITIKAMYYAKDSDKEKLQKGIDAWNNQSGKYSFEIVAGDNAGTYTINFDLSIASTNGADAPSDGISNSFEVVPDNIGGRGLTKDGNTIKLNDKAPERTVIHEIGHTLGNGEFSRAVMSQGGDSDKITKANVAASLNQAGFYCLGNFWNTQISNPSSQSCNNYYQKEGNPTYGTIKKK